MDSFSRNFMAIIIFDLKQYVSHLSTVSKMLSLHLLNLLSRPDTSSLMTRPTDNSVASFIVANKIALLNRLTPSLLTASTMATSIDHSTCPSVNTDASSSTPLTLRTWDILCGQDKRYKVRLGNLKYDQIIKKQRRRFLNCRSKAAEKKLVKEVHDSIQAYGGRFLKLDESTTTLCLMSTAECRNKISRTLRENVVSSDQRKVFVLDIGEMDVLCGRGKQARKCIFWCA